MAHRRTIVLIDADSRRRAAITHRLNSTLFHIEPFEDVGELGHSWPRGGILLVHEADCAVRDLAQQMTDAGAWLPIIAFATYADPNEVVGAVLEGALGFLIWPFDMQDVESAIIRAEGSGQAIGSAKSREVAARSRLHRLTPREREVLAAVARGLSNRMIGEVLAISPRTVEIHRANMLHKMGAQHTSEAIRVAIEASLVD
jgi:FixJ family two-component response regulator